MYKNIINDYYHDNYSLWIYKVMRTKYLWWRKFCCFLCLRRWSGRETTAHKYINTNMKLTFRTKRSSHFHLKKRQWRLKTSSWAVIASMDKNTQQKVTFKETENINRTTNEKKKSVDNPSLIDSWSLCSSETPQQRALRNNGDKNMKNYNRIWHMKSEMTSVYLSLHNSAVVP